MELHLTSDEWVSCSKCKCWLWSCFCSCIPGDDFTDTPRQYICPSCWGKTDEEINEKIKEVVQKEIIL